MVRWWRLKLNNVSPKVKCLYDKFFETESDIEKVLTFVAEQRRCNEVSTSEIKQLISIMRSQQFNLIAAKLLNMLGYLLLNQGETQAAIDLWDEAISIFEKNEDEAGIV